MNFNRWFKAQGADFLDMRLRRLPAGLFKFFYFVRCVAACNGGALPAIEQLAFLLGSRLPVIERRLAALREVGLIEERSGELRLVETGADGEAELGEPLSGADRTRRWRERRARDEKGDAPRDDAVTRCDASEEEIKEETDSARVTLGAAVYDRFDEFWSAFPSREGDNPKAPALAAWCKAVAAGADPQELVAAARAYAEATTDRERRFIASGARWLSAGAT